MRAGGIISFALHAGFVAAGMIVAPHLASRDSTPMIMLPVELLEISDSTNVTAVAESVKEEETPEIAKTEPAAAPPPPPPEESIEALPDRSKRNEPKAAATPPKPPEKKRTLQEEIDAALKGVDLSPKIPAAGTAPSPSGSPDSADDKPRQSAGDARRMTITVADYIKSQLVSRKCWTSQADMADAPRLRVVFAVSFKRDGKLAGEPRMLEPRSMPTNDMPLQVYIERARTALLKCNQPRYDVPPQYFDFNPPETIELEFRPGR